MKRFQAILLTSCCSCFWAVLSIIPQLASAQRFEHAKVDSLLALLPKLKSDTVKADVLNNLAFNYFSIDPAQGLAYGEQGVALSSKLNWDRGLAKAYNAIAANYWAKNDFRNAQIFYLKALKINEARMDKFGMAANLHNIAGVFGILNNYQKAIEYYDRGAILYQELGKNALLSGTYSNIATVYEAEHNYPLALTYYLKALDQIRATGLTIDIAFMTGKVGVIYAAMGDYKQAIDSQLKALHISEVLKAKDHVEIELGELGDTYLKLKDYDRSFDYFRRALRLSDDVNGNLSKSYQGKFIGAIGKTYLLMATDSRFLARKKILTSNDRKSLLRQAEVN